MRLKPYAADPEKYEQFIEWRLEHPGGTYTEFVGDRKEVVMAQAEHSPGPWKLTKNEYTKIVYVGGGTIDFSFGLFTDGIGSAKNQKRDWANARLIAAAPELLEACQAIADLDLGQGRRNLPMVAGQARIAIAKATGKDNKWRSGHIGPRRK